MVSLLLINLLVLVSRAFTLQPLADCQPMYWETNPTFKVYNQQLALIAAKGVSPNDITTTTGAAFHTTYTITNINGSVTFDSSKQTVTKEGDAIHVSGGVLNMAFEYEAGVKKYKGKGTANIVGVEVNYTKVAAITNGSAGFVVTNVTTSSPKAVPNNDYSPATPSTSEAEEFNTMIKTNLTLDVKNYLAANLKTLLNEAAAHSGIPSTFGSPIYIYRYGTPGNLVELTINMSVIFQRIPQTGYTIGYLGGIINSSTPCSSFKATPDNTSSSYFSTEFIHGFFEFFTRHSSLWNNILLNQTNVNIPSFGFRIIDIESVMPSVLETYTKLLDRIGVMCGIKQDPVPEVRIDDVHALLEATATWACRLFHVEDNAILLRFDAALNYRVGVMQQNNRIRTQIVQASLKSVQWYEEINFPVVNSHLAQIYLIQIISSFNRQQTIGTGFLQPQRTSPTLIFQKGAIQISEQSPNPPSPNPPSSNDLSD